MLQTGNGTAMAADIEIERALAALAAALNDHRLDEWDRRGVQKLVSETLGDRAALTVDDGGGLHDETGSRIGAIRRTSSGEWITERQNPTAENADAAIPVPGPRSKLRRTLTKLKVWG